MQLCFCFFFLREVEDNLEAKVLIGEDPEKEEEVRVKIQSQQIVKNLRKK